MPYLDYRVFNNQYEGIAKSVATCVSEMLGNVGMLLSFQGTEVPENLPFAVLIHPKKPMAVLFRISDKTLQDTEAAVRGNTHEKIRICHHLSFAFFDGNESRDVTANMGFGQGIDPKEMNLEELVYCCAQFLENDPRILEGYKFPAFEKGSIQQIVLNGLFGEILRQNHTPTPPSNDTRSLFPDGNNLN